MRLRIRFFGIYIAIEYEYPIIERALGIYKENMKKHEKTSRQRGNIGYTSGK